MKRKKNRETSRLYRGQDEWEEKDQIGKKKKKDETC